MNPFIVNYYNLFSKDDDVFRNAIKIKWNWMFRRLFFPVTFNYTLEDGKKMYNDLSECYQKAADLIERMEREGVLSKPNIAGKRDILVPTDNA